MPRNYTFTITKKDNLRYNFLLTRKRLFSTALLTVALMGGMLALIQYAQGKEPMDALLSGGLIGLGAALLFLAAGILSTVLRVGSLYKSGALKNFDVTFTIDKAGIHSKNESGDADLPWGRVRQIRETRGTIYVFYAKDRANVIPIGQLSAADAASLRTQIGKFYLQAREKAQKKG